ncbi:DUF2953 domain-containing protein [Mesobacillus subterraneus]|uniref:DUF2953 domain-containing protein n=1 Tax=Mesobacillus subterraneus TaxID=285983 RepID=UPI001CFDAB72|nr:DUF2953 domain-containing protein [Mesobacillus subterraneus]WLR56061.1 DUF2953 domain-containing protein [Mesobacillus subterraneus]
MKWVLLAILILTVLVLIIFFTKVKIFLDYFHGNDNDYFKVTIKAWGGLLKFTIEVPVVKIDDNSPTIIAEQKVKTGPDENMKQQKTTQVDKNDLLSSLHDFKQLITHITGLHKIVRDFLKKVTIRNIEWHTMVGVSDAAATGVITGAFWAVKGGVIGLLSYYMKMKEMPVMTISPSFQQTVSITSFKCMIQVRVGHAILAGIKLVKYWKGGWPEFKSKPLSALSGDNTNSV